MVGLYLYVEGGGNGKDQRTRCSQAFNQLLKNAGFKRLPRIVPGGSRNETFDKFETAVKSGLPALLLVDSEDPVADAGQCWPHLKKRDGWDKPEGAEEKHVHFMATCMETWIVADRAALRKVFGTDLRESALPPDTGLESRGREEVQERLERATQGCGRRKAYQKGKRSFQVLAELDPTVLQSKLKFFERFIGALKAEL